MNPDEEMRLEAALRKIKAAQPPPDFMARLHAAGPPRPSERPANAVGIVTGGAWTGLLRWLVPFFAITLLASNVFLVHSPSYRVALAAQVLFYCWAGLGFFFYQHMRRVQGGPPLKSYVI